MKEDTENKRTRVKAQIELVLKAIEQENSTFISIASLAVALIIILSLNKDLIFFKPIESKVLLTLFLSLIVISMATHLYFLNLSKKKSMGIVGEIMERKIMDEVNITLFEKFLAYTPKTVTGIFFISIGYIIYVIWR